MSFCHFSFVSTLLNSARNSVYVSYVDGSSRTHPHVWAIGRRASPSSLVNSIVIDLTQMTSAPMTNIRNDFSCASSMPLTKRFRYCNVVCSELLIGWTLLACIIPMTFLFVGSMSSNMLYSPSSDDNLLSCRPVCKTSFQDLRCIGVFGQFLCGLLLI